MATWPLISEALEHRSLHPALPPGRFSGFGSPLGDCFGGPTRLARARGLHGDSPRGMPEDAGMQLLDPLHRLSRLDRAGREFEARSKSISLTKTI